jgi:hypothetical protein
MKVTPRDGHGNAIGFGTMKHGFFKGQNYWERDFDPIVVMWKHDGAHKGRSRYGLRIGPLFVWRNYGLSRYRMMQLYRPWAYLVLLVALVLLTNWNF